MIVLLGVCAIGVLGFFMVGYIWLVTKIVDKFMELMHGRV